jgi:uroporphyrinogen decarboxylase
MTTGRERFRATMERHNSGRPPVWLMRQAGRYHSHYQALRARHSFLDLCKRPELAAAVTLGPIEAFDFDAAIIFSDLLFPLEALGLGLSYNEGPVLDWHLRSPSELARLRVPVPGFFDFQAQAVRLAREQLPADKALLGFVGAPLTLYFYAVAGSHQKSAPDSFDGVRAGFDDGRFDGFCEKLLPLLVEEMLVQARAGADAVAVFDTCAGEVDATLYRERVVPVLRELLTRFKAAAPDVPVTYYSKGTRPEHWAGLESLPIACLGVDWQTDLVSVLRDWGGRYAIQGNIDPSWLKLDAARLESQLRDVFGRVAALPVEARRGWVCGLGHGVLPGTPEDNVRLFMKVQREVFS